jgi:hypothetical protein
MKPPTVKCRVLLSGDVVASHTHRIYSPSGAPCVTMVLHKEGTPGAVVAHKTWISAQRANDTETARDIANLRRGLHVRTTQRLGHPDDLLRFMSHGVSYPRTKKLSFFFGPEATPKEIAEIEAFAMRAHKEGRIHGYEIIRAEDHIKIPRIDADSGKAVLAERPMGSFDEFDREWEEPR